MFSLSKKNRDTDRSLLGLLSKHRRVIALVACLAAAGVVGGNLAWERSKDKEPILNNTLGITDVAEIVVKEATFENRIKPSDAPLLYGNYYQDIKNNGTMYLDIKGTLKNLKTKEMQFGMNDPISFKVKYKEKYEYKVELLIENEDGISFEFLPTIEPLVTVKFHAVATVPEEVKALKESLVLEINLADNDEEYTIKFNY